MREIILSVVAFFILFSSDYLGLKKKKTLSFLFFLVGCFILTLNLIISTDFSLFAFSFLSYVYIILASINFLILIYVLSFALKPKGLEKKVDTKGLVPLANWGLYSKSRHPGVIFLFLACLFWLLSFQSTSLLIIFICYTLLNVLYVIWQDTYIFPKTIWQYNKYKKEVPFILPKFL